MVDRSHRSTALLAAAAVLALGTVASAKPVPVDREIVVARLADDAPVLVGPAGASLERDYFRAPSAAPFAVQRVFPCRMQMRMFEKTRVAQSCL